MTDDMTSQQRPDTWDLVQLVKWWWSLECCSAWMFLLEEGRSVIVWFNIIAHGKTSETDWKYPYVNNSKGFTQGLIFGPFIFILLTYEVPLEENLKTVDCPLKPLCSAEFVILLVLLMPKKLLNGFLWIKKKRHYWITIKYIKHMKESAKFKYLSTLTHHSFHSRTFVVFLSKF